MTTWTGTRDSSRRFCTRVAGPCGPLLHSLRDGGASRSAPRAGSLIIVLHPVACARNAAVKGDSSLTVTTSSSARARVPAAQRGIVLYWGSLLGPVRWRRAERNSLSRCRYLLAKARRSSAARNGSAWPRRYGSGLRDRSTDPSGRHVDPDSLLRWELPGLAGWWPVVHPANPHSEALVAKCSP
jgi:hypothetical protein